VRLPIDDTGEGRAVVLLHAGIADRRMWSDQIGPLADAGYRVVAMDLPGFGEAPPAREDAPWRDVLDTMDALDLEQAVIVGNSFGGAVALRVAVLAPDRVEGLVLVSAPPPRLEPSAQLRAAWEAEGDAIDRHDLDGAVSAVVDAWLGEGAPQALRDRVGAMQLRALQLQIDAQAPIEVEDPVEADPSLLRSVEVSALVMAGQFDMPDFRDGAEAMADELPWARHEVVRGAAHLAPLEQPEKFRELLLEFLSEGDEPEV
jgi:pimeloyl-ACP methyl ester carboxylesterase